MGSWSHSGEELDLRLPANFSKVKVMKLIKLKSNIITKLSVSIFVRRISLSILHVENSITT